MLLLVIQVAGNPYGIESTKIVEVVPRVELRPVPHTPPCLIGLFNYRGQAVPVVDLGLLFGGQACSPLLSSRVVIVQHGDAGPRGGRQCGRLLGLLAEHVSVISRQFADNVVFPGMNLPDAPYLDRVVRGSNDLMIQVLAVDRVLPPGLDDAFFSRHMEKA